MNDDETTVFCVDCGRFDEGTPGDDCDSVACGGTYDEVEEGDLPDPDDDTLRDDLGADSVILGDGDVAVIHHEDGGVTIASEHEDVLVPDAVLGDLRDVLELFEGLSDRSSVPPGLGGNTSTLEYEFDDRDHEGALEFMEDASEDDDTDECPECGEALTDGLGGPECAACGWGE